MVIALCGYTLCTSAPQTGHFHTVYLCRSMLLGIGFFSFPQCLHSIVVHLCTSLPHTYQGFPGFSLFPYLLCSRVLGKIAVSLGGCHQGRKVWIFLILPTWPFPTTTTGRALLVFNVFFCLYKHFMFNWLLNNRWVTGSPNCFLEDLWYVAHSRPDPLSWCVLTII